MKLQIIDRFPDAYLEDSNVVDFKTADVASRAVEVADGTSGLDAIRRIYEWVRDEVPHTADLGGGPITCAASEVLACGTGICYAKSNLLAAMLRSLDVPTGFCYQRLRKDPPYEGFELHALNAVYAKEWRTWVRIDARGNRDAMPDGRPEVCAELTRDGSKLAFPIDTCAGESEDPRVFAEPLPSTVDILRTAEDFSSLWAALPSELP